MMISRSKAKRWFPAQGDEWGFARYTTSFNTVIHVGRMFCCGKSLWVAFRSRDMRIRFPRKCDACDSRQVAWSWIIGGFDHPGIAWREEILDGIGHLSPWAWVLGDMCAGDGALGEVVRAIPGTPPCMVDGAWKFMTSFYGACPLCSKGEHGAEHLAIWRPAVAAAWTRVGLVHRLSPICALSGNREGAACAARLLHQASFIASSIHNKSSAEWNEGADWLVRAVCAPDAADEGEGMDLEIGRPGGGDEFAYIHTWEETGGCGCWGCEDRAGTDRPTSTWPRAPERDRGPPAAPARTVAAAAGSIAEGQVVVALRSRGAPAAWIVPGVHWWPPPSVGHAWEANVRWHLGICGRCRHERATLVASGPIEQGGELCADTGYLGQVRFPDEAALHFAMDGSAKGRTAGACAMLWSMGDHGRWRRFGVAAISIGSKTSPTAATAWGLSAATDLLLAHGGTDRKVHISGDCSMLLRFCAEQGRMREFVAQGIAERALARLAGAGWSCIWTIVPRKHNCAADFVAKFARIRVLARADAEPSARDRHARVSWFMHSSDTPRLNPSSLLAILRAAVAACGSGSSVRRAPHARGQSPPWVVGPRSMADHVQLPRESNGHSWLRWQAPHRFNGQPMLLSHSLPGSAGYQEQAMETLGRFGSRVRGVEEMRLQGLGWAIIVETILVRLLDPQAVRVPPHARGGRVSSGRPPRLIRRGSTWRR